MIRWAGVLVVGGALLAGCGKVRDSADGPANGGAAGADNGGNPGASGSSPGDGGDANDGGDGGVLGVLCPPALASDAEFAETPRADTNLELLALQLSPGRLIADQTIYDRVVRDVTAIRKADPSIADISFWASTDGRGIFLEGIDDEAFAEMQLGTYDWDCLNFTYRMTELQLSKPDPRFSNFAVITLKGIYDIPQLLPLYAELKGISRAGQNYGGGGDGPTICVTPSATVWHYVFDRAGGDCPAGCTTHEYHHFSTTLAGAVTSLGDLQPDEVDIYASRKVCRGL